MSVLTKSIQETFRDIVALTASDVLDTVNTLLTDSEGKAYNISSINYVYGHEREIANTMRDLARDRANHPDYFPLIWFEEDLRGSVREDFEKIYIKRLVIAWASSHNYESAQRELHSFVPVLRPIYKALMRQIERSKRFWIYDRRKDMSHEHYERKYWGTKEDGEAKNVFTDYVDAIEIRNLEIKLTPDNCSY